MNEITNNKGVLLKGEMAFILRFPPKISLKEYERIKKLLEEGKSVVLPKGTSFQLMKNE